MNDSQQDMGNDMIPELVLNQLGSSAMYMAKTNIYPVTYHAQPYLVKFLPAQTAQHHARNAALFRHLDIPFISCTALSFDACSDHIFFQTHPQLEPYAAIMPHHPAKSFEMHSEQGDLTPDQMVQFSWRVLDYAASLSIGGFFDMAPRNVLVDQTGANLQPLFIDPHYSCHDQELHNNDAYLSSVRHDVMGFACHYLDVDYMQDISEADKTERYRTMLRTGVAICLQNLEEPMGSYTHIPDATRQILRKRTCALSRLITDDDLFENAMPWSLTGPK